MKIEVIENVGKVRNTMFGNVLEALKACGVNGKVVGSETKGFNLF